MQINLQNYAIFLHFFLYMLEFFCLCLKNERFICVYQKKVVTLQQF